MENGKFRNDNTVNGDSYACSDKVHILACVFTNILNCQDLQIQYFLSLSSSPLPQAQEKVARVRSLNK